MWATTIRAVYWMQSWWTTPAKRQGICVFKSLIIKYGIYANIFAEKCEQLLHLQKLLTFFSKNTCESDIVLTRTINTLTINEFVKLTMLWTTGPEYYTYETNVRKRPFRHVRLAKIQITLCNRTVWSESSLGTFWVAQDAFYFILFIFYFFIFFLFFIFFFFFSCG